MGELDGLQGTLKMHGVMVYLIEDEQTPPIDTGVCILLNGANTEATIRGFVSGKEVFFETQALRRGQIKEGITSFFAALRAAKVVKRESQGRR